MLERIQNDFNRVIADSRDPKNNYRISKDVFDRVLVFRDFVIKFLVSRSSQDKRAYDSFIKYGMNSRKKYAFILANETIECSLKELIGRNIRYEIYNYPMDVVIDYLVDQISYVKIPDEWIVYEQNYFTDNCGEVIAVCESIIRSCVSALNSYSQYVEYPFIKAISEDWNQKLERVFSLNVGEKLESFDVVVNFVDSFKNSIFKGLNAGEKKISSCILITEESRESYFDREIGFMFRVDPRNLILMSLRDCGTAFLSFPDVFRKGNTPTLSYLDVLFENYLVYVDGEDVFRVCPYELYRKNAVRGGEIAIYNHGFGNPVLVKADTSNSMLDQALAMGSIACVPVFSWDQNNGIIERIR